VAAAAAVVAAAAAVIAAAAAVATSCLVVGIGMRCAQEHHLPKKLKTLPKFQSIAAPCLRFSLSWHGPRFIT
jgi:hypothetical protein